jgi:hypothetical protein
MSTHTATIENKFDEFKKEVLKDVDTATKANIQENRDKLIKRGAQSIFDKISEIDQLEVTEKNADTIINMYKLIDRLENELDTSSPAAIPIRVVSIGKELGFDEIMSMSIYYMVRSSKIYTDFQSRKIELYKIVTGVN